MKTTRYFLTALACLLLTACMDGDWDAPSTDPSPYGNNSIEETNVVTIAQLKDKYKNVFEASTDMAVQVNEDIKIKAWVTGNDIGSNIYQQISLQDETGAIVVGVQQSGICNYLAIGQQILVDINGLYVGAYRKQPQIGAPYNGGIGRMDRFTWQDHFKVIGTPDTDKVEQLKTDFTAGMDMFENGTKLMTLRGAILTDADGKAVFAPDDGSVTLTSNCANRSINGMSNVVVRTSTYADFAAKVMPTGKVDITGVFTRYNSTWQILLRTDKDIVTAQ